MTQDEIMQMAIEVYGSAHADDIKFAKLIEDKTRQELREEVIYKWVPPHFVDFAIRQEREACEAVCNKLSANKPDEPTSFDFRYGAGCCAQAIRARGE